MEANSNDLFNPNWETCMDQGTDPFESALSSIVSSPVASPDGGDNVMIKELIGRLGVICNSGEISPQSLFEARSTNNSTNTSYCATPLNSPPNLSLSSASMTMTDHHHHHIRGGSSFPIPYQLPSQPGLAPFSTDPGFAERAARLSCFSSRNFTPLINANFTSELPPSRDHSMTAPREMGDSCEGSSVSQQIPAGDFIANPRKRKSVQRVKQKDQAAKLSEVTVKEKEEPLAKKAKSEEEKEEVSEDGDGKKCEESGKEARDDIKNQNQKQSKDSNSKLPEPLKDYIHVRARRGQATDSHSLAERVRREKISQRMKVLQDIVPGCNKLTGKAIMLDEIINYVQSLQRQVEFLSMKLSTLNSRMDFNMEALVSKEMFQSRGSLPHHSVFPMDSSSSSPTFPYGGIPNDAMSQFSANLLNNAFHRNQGMQMPLVDGFSGVPPQVSEMWGEDDLQSLVQMGIAQNQLLSLHGAMASSQMKVEL